MGKSVNRKAVSMGQWWERQWGLRLHAIMLPFGVFIVTALLTRWTSGQWPGRNNLELAADLVDLSTVVYGMIALTVEGRYQAYVLGVAEAPGVAGVDAGGGA